MANEAAIIEKLRHPEVSIEDKMDLVHGIRAKLVDQFLVQQVHENIKLREGLVTAQSVQGKLKEMIDKVMCPPLFPAVVQKTLQTNIGMKALVIIDNKSVVVEVAPDVSVKAGDAVLLNCERNLILERNEASAPTCGDTATFMRLLPDGRLVVNFKSDEFVVESSPALKASKLQPGDTVRWDVMAKMAYEKIEREDAKQYLLQEVEQISPDKIGGQQENFAKIIDALTVTLLAPDKAKDYGLASRQASILMIGPPGTGKTLMAKVAASEISRQGGKKCRFAVVKPGEWKDPYVGVTEMKIRNCFKALKESAKGGFAVLFLDEIESVGRLRGGGSNVHSDNALGALLAELDGFTDRANVAIIAASNRKDLIDPALLERISEVEVVVDRPSRDGAKEIFGIHLPASLPFSPNGASSKATRKEAIEVAVEAFYSEKSPGLCALRFSNGKKRMVFPHDLASGRLFEQVCRVAKRGAFLRDARGGDAGINVSDVEVAAEGTLERLSTTVTPLNAHAYLPDLPLDAQVVDVEAAWK
jgi:proteasome-associated ATPase